MIYFDYVVPLTYLFGHFLDINKNILSYKHELDSLRKVEKIHFDILDFVVHTSPLPNTSKLRPKVAANPLIEKGKSSQVERRKKVQE